MLEGTKNPGEG